MTTCTRCDCSGFLNIEQVPGEIADEGVDAVLAWIKEQDPSTHDVQICDCCGDGEQWHGEPGQHYGPDDPIGQSGPYASNGGLCHCH